jgi:hypothetical protein
MSGEFTVDLSSQAVVTLNGEDVNRAFESIRLSPGKNFIEIKINSF